MRWSFTFSRMAGTRSKTPTPTSHVTTHLAAVAITVKTSPPRSRRPLTDKLSRLAVGEPFRQIPRNDLSQLPKEHQEPTIKNWTGDPSHWEQLSHHSCQIIALKSLCKCPKCFDAVIYLFQSQFFEKQTKANTNLIFCLLYLLVTPISKIE